MSDNQRETSWQSKLLQPRLPWQKDPMRPADVNEGLLAAMLDRRNFLEDVKYNKIIPNEYIVELSEDNYIRNYQPIEKQVLQQWKTSMLERLLVANSRQGRKEYRFAGQLKISMRAAHELQTSQARILSRVQADDIGGRTIEGASSACLLWQQGERKWSLELEKTTIGRDPRCDIFLDMPVVQERRLVSGLHAYVSSEYGEFTLFDGEPGGRASVNGTFVNGRLVPATGSKLQEGDIIILASLDRMNPRADTPGAAVLEFHLNCP